jgi:hypothetical protein
MLTLFEVRLRGEVHRLIAPRDQKYQSNFVEVRANDLHAVLTLSSSAMIRSSTVDTPVSSFVAAWIPTITSWLTWRLSTCLSRFWVSPVLASGRLLLTQTDAFFQNVCELDLVFSFYKVSVYGFGQVLTSRFMPSLTRYSSLVKSRKLARMLYSIDSTTWRSWNDQDLMIVCISVFTSEACVASPWLHGAWFEPILLAKPQSVTASRAATTVKMPKVPLPVSYVMLTVPQHCNLNCTTICLGSTGTSRSLFSRFSYNHRGVREMDPPPLIFPPP